MLDSTGFLGTRADGLIDVSLVFLTATPILMGYAMTFAAGREYLKHRNLQLVGLLLGFGAVVLLETSLQLGSAKGFLLSEFYGTPAMNRLFGVHLAVAIPSFPAVGNPGDRVLEALYLCSSRDFQSPSPRVGATDIPRSVPHVRDRHCPLCHGLRVLTPPFSLAPSAGSPEHPREDVSGQMATATGGIKRYRGSATTSRPVM